MVQPQEQNNMVHHSVAHGNQHEHAASTFYIISFSLEILSESASTSPCLDHGNND